MLHTVLVVKLRKSKQDVKSLEIKRLVCAAKNSVYWVCIILYFDFDVSLLIVRMIFFYPFLEYVHNLTRLHGIFADYICRDTM